MWSGENRVDWVSRALYACMHWLTDRAGQALSIDEGHVSVVVVWEPPNPGFHPFPEVIPRSTQNHDLRN